MALRALGLEDLGALRFVTVLGHGCILFGYRVGVGRRVDGDLSALARLLWEEVWRRYAHASLPHHALSPTKCVSIIYYSEIDRPGGGWAGK